MDDILLPLNIAFTVFGPIIIFNSDSTQVQSSILQIFIKLI